MGLRHRATRELAGLDVDAAEQRGVDHDGHLHLAAGRCGEAVAERGHLGIRERRGARDGRLRDPFTDRVEAAELSRDLGQPLDAATIEEKADLVVLDMKTPGGALDVTFEIMEAIAKFQGRTLTFVNNEALSAGAFISATTDEIWFSPEGVIGAAAPVMSTGQEIDATMRQKIVSYLKARVRATSSAVVRTMVSSRPGAHLDGRP